MSKLYNSFRPNKYYRSKFQEAKYLLASEATDLQLESFEQLRNHIKQTYGDVCVSDAFLVENKSGTLVVRPGEGWCDGLPFLLKSGTDALVNGGTLPLNTTVTDLSATSTDVGGKAITFNSGGTTPALAYSVVIEALEELVKASGSPETGVAIDPFLIGENLSETTEFKGRLIYKIHVVPSADLTNTPTYPLSGSTYHYVNEISVTPTASDLKISSVSLTALSTEGANCSVTFLNTAKKIPYSSPDVDEYIYGQLIDSDGNNFTIIDSSFTGSGETVTFLISREPAVGDDAAKTTVPVTVQNVPFRLVKRDHYVVDSATGISTGKRYLKVATFSYSTPTISNLEDTRAVTEFRDHNHDGTQGEASVIRPTQIISTGSIAGTAISGTTIASSGAITGGSVATTGNITTSVGNIVATSGYISSGSTISASGSISSNTGNFNATGGNVNALAVSPNGVIAGRSITATENIAATGAITGSSVTTTGDITCGAHLSTSSFQANSTGYFADTLTAHDGLYVNPATGDSSGLSFKFYGDSFPAAWGTINSNGTSGRTWNYSGGSHTSGSGIYRINLSNTMANTSYPVIVTVFSSAAIIATVQSVDSDSFDVYIAFAASGTRTDAAFSYVVFRG